MKEQDSFEKFITQYREAFDSERPSLKTWTTIEKSIPKYSPKRRRLIWIRSVAAVGLLVLGIGVGYFITPKIFQDRQLYALNTSPEIVDMETYFIGEIDQRFMVLANNPNLPELKEELDRIDLNIEDLKIDLLNAPTHSKDRILEAIIASYETKVQLLETAIDQNQPVNFNENEDEIQL